jgi:hypothetical protein
VQPVGRARVAFAPIWPRLWNWPLRFARSLLGVNHCTNPDNLMDLYTTLPWASVCARVAKLNVQPHASAAARRPADVAQRSVARVPKVVGAQLYGFVAVERTSQPRVSSSSTIAPADSIAPV